MGINNATQDDSSYDMSQSHDEVTVDEGTYSTGNEIADMKRKKTAKNQSKCGQISCKKLYILIAVLAFVAVITTLSIR